MATSSSSTRRRHRWGSGGPSAPAILPTVAEKLRDGKAVMIWHEKAFGSAAMVESRARVGHQNLMKSRINGATNYRGLNLIS
jgi:hypothetical protein